ncbi:MAG TPA: hypothetical protein VML50_12830 [Anaeromyxobacter sp.]|nr:hypothetical protein [Anaeromyxobacter sp.]
MHPLALALALAAAPGPTGAAPAAFSDDYAAALQAARARHVPLLVDVWAPW